MFYYYKNANVIFLRSHGQTVVVLKGHVPELFASRAGGLDSCHKVLLYKSRKAEIVMSCLILTSFRGLSRYLTLICLCFLIFKMKALGFSTIYCKDDASLSVILQV